MSLSPTIITAANPEWFYNSKILTLHKDSIIALGWPFTLQRSINYFFLGLVLKYTSFFLLKVTSWEDVEFFMKTWKISTWDDRLLSSPFCPQKHPRIEQWCGAKYTVKLKEFQKWIERGARGRFKRSKGQNNNFQLQFETSWAEQICLAPALGAFHCQ